MKRTFSGVSRFGIVAILVLCQMGAAWATDPAAPTMRSRDRPTPALSACAIAVNPTTVPASPDSAIPALPTYVVIDVMPSAGTRYSRGYGINNKGQIVGRTYNVDDATQTVTDLRAMVWDFRTGSRILDTLGGDSGGWGINDTGMACGFSTTIDGDQRAVRWELSDGSVTDLGTLVNTTSGVGGDASYAYGGINDSGTVVGNADIPNDDGSFMASHGFIYDDVDGMRDLGTLNTDSYYMGGYSIAYDVTEDDTVVGITHIDGWDFRAFTWTAADGMTALATDGVRDDGEWYATAINASGLIGGLVIYGGNSYPCYWPAADALPVAMEMPAAYPFGETYAVNDRGRMVGLMFDAADAESAFIFDRSLGIVDLNDRIDPAGGWVLLDAVDINDLGQITGTGWIDGGKRAYLLTPDADTDLDADIDGQDLARMAAEMGTPACDGACSADLDRDGAVDAVDAALLAILFGSAG